MPHPISPSGTPDSDAARPDPAGLDFLAIDAPLAGMAAESADIHARIAAGRDWTRDTLIGAPEIGARARSGTDPAPARFNFLSLAAWLALAECAKIAAIPARGIGAIPVATYEGAMEQDPVHGAAMDDIDEAIAASVGAGEVLRFDQVAPGAVKAARSDGQPLARGLLYSPVFEREILTIYDDRFFETMLDHGGATIAAYARPRYTPVMISGIYNAMSGEWPAEFRIFIESGEVVGISNYYPQVAMDPGRFGAAARDALAKARTMLATMDALRLGVGSHRLAPDIDPSTPKEPRPAWMPPHWSPRDFTLDFFAVSETQTVFLEGGPAGMQAAHPCCFLQEGRTAGAGFLHGAAFALDAPICPLADIPTGAG